MKHPSGGNMKKSLAAAFIGVVLLVLTGCETPTGESTVVGSSGDQVISGLAFFLDTTYVDGSGQGTLIAKGTVRNNGSYNVSSPWYLEGQFYTDATLRTKLGGNYVQVGVPLSPGQQTLWTLTFTSSNTDVRQFPGFRVGDMRGIYKQ
jgi:hypothetical protein